MSLVMDVLEISTNEARVDIEAARISSRMTTVRADGTTVISISGIKASKMGLPFSVNASGLVAGFKKTLVNAPVK